jgi:RimJ/RimL family protein N-acetyltransferase
MRQQFVYSLPHSKWQSEDADNVIQVSSSGALISQYASLKQFFSITDIIKTWLKILLGKRSICIITEDKDVAAWCVITYGFCSHYDIGSNDAVIGPVNTLPAHQGKGLATRIMRGAISQAFETRKCENIYIDTAENNIAMQKVIERCQFGPPILRYDRQD